MPPIDGSARVSCTPAARQEAFDLRREIGLHRADVPFDAIAVEFGIAQGGHVGDHRLVVRELLNGPLYQLGDRLVRSALLEGLPEPRQMGVVVGEQQIVLGREVPVERA